MGCAFCYSSENLYGFSKPFDCFRGPLIVLALLVVCLVTLSWLCKCVACMSYCCPRRRDEVIVKVDYGQQLVVAEQGYVPVAIKQEIS